MSPGLVIGRFAFRIYITTTYSNERQETFTIISNPPIVPDLQMSYGSHP
jgi:hypothetical protein